MRKVLKYPLAALLVLVGVMAASLTATAPAHAYDDGAGLWRWTSFNTGSCYRVNGNGPTVYSRGDYCVVEGRSFRKDSGGVGLYAEFIPNYCCNSKETYRVEWHPYGEHLKVCDLAADGDTIYARLRYKSYNWYWASSSPVSGCRDANYSFAEGTEIRLYLYDNKSMSDFMTAFYSLRG